MSVSSATKSSTLKRSDRRLSEVARHVVIPKGIVTSGWAPVEARCAEFGDSFDEWQRGLGRLVLGKRESGEYAATVGGVTLSIPRQVAKTFIVSRIVFALCTLFPNLTVLWTAHRIRTTSKTFATLRGFAQKASVAVHVESIRSANGEQEIRFKNGSVIMFGAREQGFGRGFDEVDIEVFDEAQILTEKALEDMVAATNQSRFPAGALLFYMGTPPRPTDPGEAFTARRLEALAGESEDAVYVECSADPDADPDDRKQWAKANPSYPERTPLRSMLRLRKNLTNDDSWRREALGIWDDPRSVRAVIPFDRWRLNSCGPSVRVAQPVVSVDVRTGLDQSFAIGVAGSAEVNGELVDVVDLARYEVGRGKTWPADYIVNELLEILHRNGLSSVVVDGYGDGNGALVPLLEQAGVEVVKLNLADMRSGTVGFVDANLNGRVSHVSYEGAPALDVAVAGAVTRKSSGGFLWDQSRAGVDLTPLRAATAAWWVHHVDGGIAGDPLDSMF